MGIVYSCTNITNNKVYIGITIRSLDVRRKEHLKELKNNSKSGDWQRDYNNTPDASNFIFQVIETVEDNLVLGERELLYIDYFNTLEPYGYNIRYSSGTLAYTVERDPLETSKYTLDQLSMSIDYIIDNTNQLTIDEISRITKVDSTCLADISRLKSYCWLEKYIPDKYRVLKNMHNSSVNRVVFHHKDKVLEALHLLVSTNLTAANIGVLVGLTTEKVEDLRSGKCYTWLNTESPIEYKKLLELNEIKRCARSKEKVLENIATGEKYTFTSNSEVSRRLGIDHRRVSDLVSGKKKIIYDTYILGE